MYLPPLFPTLLRTTGAGFCYNIGRVISACGVVFSGSLSSGGDFKKTLIFASMLSCRQFSSPAFAARAEGFLRGTAESARGLIRLRSWDSRGECIELEACPSYLLGVARVPCQIREGCVPPQP
jgi:hypothetical protein